MECLACNSSSGLKNINKNLNLLCCEVCNAVFLEKEYHEQESKYLQENSKIHQYMRKFIDIPIENKIADFYLKYLKSKTLMKFENALDIGAGYGCFVKKLKDCEIKTDGIEYSKQKINNAIVDNIKFKKFDESYIFDQKFDLVCLTQILNYLRNTYEILESIEKKLNQNGSIFIATSNPESKYIIRDYSNASEESYYANMLYSKKNFEMACKKIGLILKDYSVFREDITLDFTNKNRLLTYIKYRLNLKKLFVPDPEGNLALILLTKE